MTRRRALLLAVILLLSIAGTLVGSPLYAFERLYFTDASRAVVCGYRNVYCDRTTWGGCVTPYYDDEFIQECDDRVEPLALVDVRADAWKGEHRPAPSWSATGLEQCRSFVPMDARRTSTSRRAERGSPS